MTSSSPTIRIRAETVQRLAQGIEDNTHHLKGPFMSQTPLHATPSSSFPSTPSELESKFTFDDARGTSVKPWHKFTRWVVVPSSSFKFLLLPLVPYLNWEFFTPYIAPGVTNPFAAFLFISNPIPTSAPGGTRYAKSYLDLLFIAYYVVFWSFVRQTIIITFCRPAAKYFGLRKEAKIFRFGEQCYAMLYFGFMGAFGVWIMSDLPTWWFRTEYLFLGYPHWDMKRELKYYYLLQLSYWLQQLLVLILGLEKPRKDHAELVAHHFITLWLVGWSYLTNLTLIGNAIFISMDIPDVLLALSKLLNYLQRERAKIVSFLTFICVWSYFRHWLNLVILYRAWHEFELIPDEARRWSPADGVWLARWMKYQVFFPIACLQGLNLFWYFLMMRILVRTITTRDVVDDRSEDEGEDEDLDAKAKEE